MQSCFYTGRIRHRRFTHPLHAFSYRLFMVCLDIEALDSVFSRTWFWSARRPAPAWFRRADYFGDPETPLHLEVRRTVRERLGREVGGPIYLLTHLRYFGVRMNPVSFYFCWDETRSRLEAVVLEVTNTPWGERQLYVVDFTQPARGAQLFDKTLHVSPFLSMDMCYRLFCRPHEQRLSVHLENWREGDKVFDATLSLRRRPITRTTAALLLVGYPWMTLQVLGAIYFEAARLWWKGARFHPHPGQDTTNKEPIPS